VILDDDKRMTNKIVTNILAFTNLLKAPAIDLWLNETASLPMNSLTKTKKIARYGPPTLTRIDKLPLCVFLIQRFRRRGEKSWHSLRVVPNDSLSMHVYQLDSDTSYDFVVVARDLHGIAHFSPLVTAVTAGKSVDSAAAQRRTVRAKQEVRFRFRDQPLIVRRTAVDFWR
jgi:hypothetical protein